VPDIPPEKWQSFLEWQRRVHERPEGRERTIEEQIQDRLYGLMAEYTDVGFEVLAISMSIQDLEGKIYNAQVGESKDKIIDLDNDNQPNA